MPAPRASSKKNTRDSANDYTINAKEHEAATTEKGENQTKGAIASERCDNRADQMRNSQLITSPSVWEHEDDGTSHSRDRQQE